MSRGIQSYNSRAFVDAQRKVMRRNIRDAYARGYQDAVTIKDLFDNLFKETSKALPKAEDEAKRSTLEKIKALAIKAFKAAKSGSFKVAITIAGNIDALAKKIRELAISAIAKLIASVCYRFDKRRARFVSKGGDYDNGNSIDIDYTILS